ncbi:biotin sulfoxide reductase domain protein, partial [Bordetella bronchiseptica MBORD624]
MKERDTNAARPDGEPPVQWRRHSSHWGVFDAAHTGDRLKVRPFAGDPDPNRLIENLPDAIRHGVRVPEPMVRLGWLRDGPGPDTRRGSDDYVPMSWDEILDRLARELRRVVDHHGTAGVFGGSYGWSSAGRFHHAQSQLHRFLNVALGGYVRSVHSYSSGAAQVVLPHVVGGFDEVTLCNVSWEQITRHTDVVLAFGGMALKNSRVAAGGVSRHIERQAMAQAAGRGCRFYTIGPQRDDLPTEAAATWLPVVPGTDVALMLGIAHTLVAAGLHDRDFVVDFCDGWPVFEDYLLGRADGLAKNAAWAAALCGIDAAAITELALGLAGKRVLVT